MTIDRVEDYWSKLIQADVEIRPVGEEFKVYIDGVQSYTAESLADCEEFLDMLPGLMDADDE